VRVAAWTIAAIKQLLAGVARCSAVFARSAQQRRAAGPIAPPSRTKEVRNWGGRVPQQGPAAGGRRQRRRRRRLRPRAWTQTKSTAAMTKPRRLLAPGRRLHYPLTFAVNLLQCAVGCATHGTLYASAAHNGGALRALALASIGNGTSWMVFYTCFSPLPFRCVGLLINAKDVQRLAPPAPALL
jgi:hypothetical protein